ncbi:type II CAAX prenyl endopeptidase Rce1 family protein [Rubrivirga sp. IMCC43871]|uniref:CPBP family glutamic-type intramembrane protease n=1 Tax=Rubrivirga sp. IMCC43871 TaxID=3391575 RepID=UPI003990337F
MAVGTTWLLFVLALPSLDAQGSGLEALVGGGLVGLPLVVVGSLATSQCRPIPERDHAQRTRLAGAALLIGVGVGAINLGANLAMATADTGIRALLDDHFAVPLTWTRTASVAVVEEVVFRLVLMSVVAWVVARFAGRARTVFLTALVVSASLFAVVHLLGRPLPVHPTSAALYASVVVLKSGVAGLVLGWVFWRWGLPYAILCHFAANGLHNVFEPVLFS